MRYLLGLVVKSAPVRPARDVAAYALEEQLADAPPLAAPVPASLASGAPAPVSSARAASDARATVRDAHDDMRSVARDARAMDDAGDAGDAPRHGARASDVTEPPRPRLAAPLAGESAPAAAAPRGAQPEPVREHTHERVVVDRIHERTTHVERVERVTAVVRPAAPAVATAAPATAAVARRAVLPPAAPPPPAPRVPDVTIAIGTIEVRGESTSSPPPRRANRPRLSLDEYLASRGGAR